MGLAFKKMGCVYVNAMCGLADVPVVEPTSGRFVIHFLGGGARFRAEAARGAFALGHHAEVYENIEELVECPPRVGVVVAYDDPALGGVLAIRTRLIAEGIWVPLVAVHEDPNVETVVAAIKAGALDYIALPLTSDRLVEVQSVNADQIANYASVHKKMVAARDRLAALSPREREVLDNLAEGHANKAIALVLQISPRTVEIHRASMMRKLGANHAAEAVRLWLEARAQMSGLLIAA